MGRGLTRAALASLSTRTWKTTIQGSPVLLQGAELVDLYEAIRAGRPDFWAVLGVERATERKCDRALQLLRRHKLIRFDRGTRRWKALLEDGGDTPLLG